MRGVAQFMSEYGLWLIGFLVLVTLIVALLRLFIDNRKMEAWKAFAAIVLVIVLVPQAWVWITEKVGPDKECPWPTTSEQTCTVTTAWSAWMRQDVDGNYVLCREIGSVSEGMQRDGVQFWRLRSQEGERTFKYKLVPQGARCAFESERANVRPAPSGRPQVAAGAAPCSDPDPYVRECPVSSNWSRWIAIPAQYSNHQLCYSPVSLTRIEWSGNRFRLQTKEKDVETVVMYNVQPKEHECQNVYR